MTAKLNQILAIEKGIKSHSHSEISEVYKTVQHADAFNGLARAYEPLEDGDALPPENKRVTATVDECVKRFQRAMTDIMDVTARKDWTNQVAVADVVVNDAVLIPKVPVTYLLFLEKNLTDLRTFIAALPVLDAAEEWKRDASSGLMKAKETKTHRTKKVQRPIVLYQATVEHPAQTQLITEDVIAGYWVQHKLSGAIDRPTKEKMLERIDVLAEAVKTARESANMRDEVDTPSAADAIFNFINAA